MCCAQVACVWSHDHFNQQTVGNTAEWFAELGSTICILGTYRQYEQ